MLIFKSNIIEILSHSWQQGLIFKMTCIDLLDHIISY